MIAAKGPFESRSGETPVASDEFLSFDEFVATLDSAHRRFESRLGELRNLVADGRVALFGYGGKGRALALQIASGSRAEVTVYDSRAEPMALAALDGFPTVTELDELYAQGSGVILGACQAQLEQAAIVQSNHIYYQEAAYLFDTAHHANKAREFSSWITGNRERLYELYLSVHPQSRDPLVGVLRYRLSLDPDDLASTRNDSAGMWFDVLESHGRRHYLAFLDVGAFDGDTLREARRRLAVTRGIAVEANTELFESINGVAASYERGVRIVPRAAWSRRCRLHISEFRGGMISVVEAEDGELDAAPIDEGVDEPVDLIKMDIEGAELPALQGCLRTLRNGPDLAIAAYHRPDDLLQIPAALAKAGYTRGAFDLHVRHYSDCFDDTILYFVEH